MTGKAYSPPRQKSLPAKFQPGFLATMDQRSAVVKQLRANYATIIEDLGGADEIAHIKSAMVERFVFLESLLQTIETDLASGAIDRDAALGKWTQAVNSLIGLARALGLDRKARDGNWSFDLNDEAASDD